MPPTVPPKRAWESAFQQLNDAIKNSAQKERGEISSHIKSAAPLAQKSAEIKAEVEKLWASRYVIPDAKARLEATESEEQTTLLSLMTTMRKILKSYDSSISQIGDGLNALNALDSKRLPTTSRLELIKRREEARQSVTERLKGLEKSFDEWEYMLHDRKSRYYVKVDLPIMDRRLIEAKENPNNSQALDRAQSAFIKAYDKAATEVIFINDQASLNPSLFESGKQKIGEEGKAIMIQDLKSKIEAAIEIRQKNFDDLEHRVSDGKTQSSVFESIASELEGLAKYQGHLIAIGEPEKIHSVEKSHFENLAVAYRIRALRAKVEEVALQVTDPKMKARVEETAAYVHTSSRSLEDAFVRHELARRSENIGASSNPSAPSPEERQVITETIAGAYADLSTQFDSFHKDAAEEKVKTLCESIMNDASRLAECIQESATQLGQPSDISPESRAKILQNYLDGDFGQWKVEPVVSEPLKAEEQSTPEEARTRTREEQSNDGHEAAALAEQKLAEKRIMEWKKSIASLERRLAEAQSRFVEARKKARGLQRSPNERRGYSPGLLEFYAKDVADKAKEAAKLCRELAELHSRLAAIGDDVRVNQTAATTYGQQATARDNAKKTHQDLASKWYLERKKQCVAEKPTYGELQSISDSEIESVTSEKLPHARLARDKDGKPERDEEKRLLYIHIIESLITFKGGEQCAPHWKYKSHKIDDVTKEDLLAGREGKFFLCQLKAGKDRLKGKTYEEQQKLEGRDVKIYHGPVNRPEKLRERLDGLEARDLALQQANTQDAPGRGGRH